MGCFVLGPKVPGAQGCCTRGGQEQWSSGRGLVGVGAGTGHGQVQLRQQPYCAMGISDLGTSEIHMYGVTTISPEGSTARSASATLSWMTLKGRPDSASWAGSWTRSLGFGK